MFLSCQEYCQLSVLMPAFGTWMQVRGGLLHRFLVSRPHEPCAAPGVMIAVPVRCDIHLTAFGRMTVFTRVIDASVICAKMIQIRGVHFMHTGIQIDAVRIRVVGNTVFRDDDPAVLLIAFRPVRALTRSAADCVTGPGMRVICAAECKIRGAENGDKRSGPIVCPQFHNVISGEYF